MLRLLITSLQYRAEVVRIGSFCKYSKIYFLNKNQRLVKDPFSYGVHQFAS